MRQCGELRVPEAEAVAETLAETIAVVETVTVVVSVYVSDTAAAHTLLVAELVLQVCLECL